MCEHHFVFDEDEDNWVCIKCGYQNGDE